MHPALIELVEHLAAIEVEEFVTEQSEGNEKTAEDHE